jgi:hypothetical protein
MKENLMSADCINTMTENGRNLTPIAIVEIARGVLGEISLDPASDTLANETIGAKRIFTVEDDGYSKEWMASTVWLNPPGKTKSQGKQVKASHWFRKLYRAWKDGNIGSAIGLVYRGGSVGSLGIDILSDALVCITAAGAPCVNGSGRLSFDRVEDDRRVSETDNTQSSVIFLLSQEPIIRTRFSDRFSDLGVVLAKHS